MKRLICTLAAAAAVLIQAVPAGAERTAISIRTIGTLTGPTTAEGSWLATGAIEDAGTYSETFELVDTEIVFRKVLVGSRGTIVLEGRATVEFDGCTARFTGGRWRIVAGTGAYAKLRGRGKPVTTPASTGDVCTGAVDVTHAGDAKVAGGD